MYEIEEYLFDKKPIVAELIPDSDEVIIIVQENNERYVTIYNYKTGVRRYHESPAGVYDLALHTETGRVCYVVYTGRPDFSYRLVSDQQSGKIAAADDAEPLSFSLSPPYPNPFNELTTLNFTIPAPGDVELTIYAVTGQKVKTIVPGTVDRGMHRIIWNGRDDEGRHLSSGLYIARLAWNGRSTAARMTLIK